VRSAISTLCLLFFLAPGLAGAQRFLAFGDSITHGLRDPGVDCAIPSSAAGYPPRLEELLRDAGLEAPEMASFGVCGETTSEGLSRIDDVLDEGGEVILIMEGTNDISARVGIETMRFNVSEMARKAREAGIEPVYASVIPRGPEGTPDTDNSRAALWRFWLENDSADAGHEFADPFTLFQETPNLFEVYYSSEDPFHPNALGYDLLAQAFVAPAMAAAEKLGCDPVGPCVADDESLCLNQDRFRVRVRWRNFKDEGGDGQAVKLTGDTGYFWFFDPENVELILKVLDGRDFNDHFWVFYGALSNVEYTITVTDTETGICRQYMNPLEIFGSRGDTMAFMIPPDDDGSGDDGSGDDGSGDDDTGQSGSKFEWRAAALPASFGRESERALSPKACSTETESLCLNQERFKVEVEWRNFQGETGTGKAVGLTGDTGYFWFFNSNNVELVVKVLDGRDFNDHYWVFYGALSNVQYTLTVTDTETGEVAIYDNPLGNFGSRGDTTAFLVEE